MKDLKLANGFTSYEIKERITIEHIEVCSHTLDELREILKDEMKSSTSPNFY